MEDEGNPTELKAQSRVGNVLRGKWRLDRLIGVGGMAAVYAATHRNGKRGAVKMLHVELSAHEGLRRRFLREGYAANTVDHPGAVSVLDDDIAEDNAVFLVMELLDGQSLEAISLERPDRRLTVGEVLAVADALLDVLTAAHDKGIVHRDLKPDNLFVTKRGELKVLDFGIARLLDQQGGSGGGTKTGTTLGTPAYMPPEQALGNVDQIDPRTDIWAAGATLFSLLTGHAVHQAPTLSQLLLAAMTQPAPSLATELPGAPPELVQLVDRSLAFEREGRWQNAREMRVAVQALRDRVGGKLPAVSATAGAGAGVGATAAATGSPSGMGLGIGVGTSPSGMIPGTRTPSGGSGTEFAAPAPAPAPATAPTPAGAGGTFPSGPPPGLVSAGTTGGASVTAAGPTPSSNRGVLFGVIGLGMVAAAALIAFFVMRQPPSGASESSPAGTTLAPEVTATATATQLAATSVPTTATATPSTEPTATVAVAADAGAPTPGKGGTPGKPTQKKPGGTGFNW